MEFLGIRQNFQQWPPMFPDEIAMPAFGTGWRKLAETDKCHIVLLD
jgi:hypothetical protein